MKVLIVEDENLAVEQLRQFVQRYDTSVEIVEVLDTVEDCVVWLQHNAAPDIIFMDIHLSDGLCFEIFSQVKVRTPVIFTTAYDQYAIQAFKFNSVDYLLKPLKYEELAAALDQFREVHYEPRQQSIDYEQLRATLLQLQHNYKNRFVIKAGEHIRFKTTEETAYMYAEGKISYLVDREGRKYIIDYTLEELESLLDPTIFFRATRKVVVKISSIGKIVSYPNSRLKLYLNPPFAADVIVSRDKTPLFLKWLDK